MQHRFLGNSGLKVSEISYGNWITHGSQVEDDAAHACVARALELGITTFDTADVYAGTRAEEVMGRALASQRRDKLEIFTKVYWPTSSSPNGRGLSRKHICESIDGSLRRLGTDYVDLYQAHRYDHQTPLEETMLAFADLVRSGKVLYVGVSEWTADWYDKGYYAMSPARNPTGPSSGSARVLRGGSWYHYFADYARAASRYYYFPPFRDDVIGFRCSRTE
jgi:aryl-alcohol dehydrogenase-like predicted oxidoreductase